MADNVPTPKSERQRRLQQLIDNDPLLTDDMLANRLGVSVQTIRLDRMELGVPEMRERAKNIVNMLQDRVKALALTEVVGELVHVQLGERGVSILETTRDMAFMRTEIVRGHILFAQCNSLAIATIDATHAVTGSASIQFHRPVKVGDRVVAQAQIQRVQGARSYVAVESHVDEVKVFSGELTVFTLNARGDALTEEGAPW